MRSRTAIADKGEHSMNPNSEIYSLRVNGKTHEIRDSWVGESLLYVLRERLNLPGTKGACEQGECGSCTVIMDGQAVCSCLVMAATAIEAEIQTVENLSAVNSLTDVQDAFVTEGGVQCGFCTPGLVVAIEHLLSQNPDPSEIEVKEAISGNICRCTGYGRIFEAVEKAVSVRKAQIS
ncbi:MAG: (2Fe-2S)-binding protein [Acidimicrobiaceae bacterium]